MPVIRPSARKSMAGDTTALAKPVMGTRVPAPPNRASLLYRFSPVNRADRNTRLMEVAEAASSRGSSTSQPVWIKLAHHADSPADAEGQGHVLQQGRLLLHALDIGLVFLG